MSFFLRQIFSIVWGKYLMHSNNYFFRIPQNMLTWCVQWLYNIINIPKCIFKMIEILPAARMLLRRTLLREHLHWRHLQGRHVADVWRHLTMKSTISVLTSLYLKWARLLKKSPLTGGLKDFCLPTHCPSVRVLLTKKPISGREINNFNNRFIKS